ncbi:MAG TPA: hypothetical protein VFX30_14030 [bacterium]|nr:hypothetical protein [bacterium]
MITRLAPTFSVLFPDVFLTKMAEQGFGCPARSDLVGRTNYFTALQTRVNQLLVVPALRSSLRAETIGLLSPMRTAHRLPGNFPLVDTSTAEALTDLLIAKDGLLDVLSGGLELVEGYKPARKEHRPWFLLLHSLEKTGVLEGIEEIKEGEMTAPGFPGHPGGRVFVANKARLEEFKRDARQLNNAQVTAKTAIPIDADAASLVKILGNR